MSRAISSAISAIVVNLLLYHVNNNSVPALDSAIDGEMPERVELHHFSVIARGPLHWNYMPSAITRCDRHPGRRIRVLTEPLVIIIVIHYLTSANRHNIYFTETKRFKLGSNLPGNADVLIYKL